MKNRKFFGLSPALMLEDLKIYWFGPALTLLLYLMQNAVPLLKPFENRASITQNLNSIGFVSCGFMVAIPFFASLILLEYYHRANKSLVLHGQPYSKSKLFNTQVLTGWLMFIIPVVIVAIIYLISMKGVVAKEVAEVTARNAAHSSNMYVVMLAKTYTVQSVLRWLLMNVSFMTFFYGIFTLMGAITGNIVLHVIMSIVGFFIVPALGFTINVYQEAFVSNYGGPGQFIQWILYDTNPAIRHFGSSLEYVSILSMIVFLVVGIALVFLAKFCVVWAKLEKTGSGILFQPLEEVITGLACFFGMTGTGFIFLLIFKSDSLTFFFIGLLVGLLITFFIVKLIIHRTAKIFNRHNLKVLTIIIIAMIVFILSVLFDFSGYSKQVPDAKDMESVRIEGLIGSCQMYVGFEAFDECLENLNVADKYDCYVHDTNFINKVVNLQGYIISNKLYQKTTDNWKFNEPNKDGYYYNWYEPDSYLDQPQMVIDTLSIEYVMKNGSTFSRSITFKRTSNVEKYISDILDYLNYDLSKAQRFSYEIIEITEPDIAQLS